MTDKTIEGQHLDLGKFVDWVWALKQERDELLAELAQAKLIGRLAYNFDGYKQVLDEREDFRQRLTVAEQRAATLGGLLRKVSELACERMDCELQFAVDDVLKPAAEGEGS